MENKTKITAEAVAEHLTDKDAEAIAAAYLDLGITSSEDAEAIAAEIEEAYQGQYKSDKEFAQEIHEQTKDTRENTFAIWPYSCIDWEWAARELMMDYSEQDGYYFRNL